MNKIKFPIQPIYVDGKGTIRFRENRIINTLLNSSQYDMNDLARMDFTDEEREQFAQLIGYSLGGFADLSYVSDNTYEVAEKIFHSKMNEQEAELAYLREQLNKTHVILKELVPKLFKIHPDDLEY